MMLEHHDSAVCLIVDRRYGTERPRLEALFGHLTDFRFFVDGEGTRLRPDLYDQTTLSDRPPWFNLGPGEWRHHNAFRKIIRRARDEGRRGPLFLEDDVVLTGESDAVVAAATVQMAALAPWDVLYYGANHTYAVTEDLAPNVLRVDGSFCTHCVAFRDTTFDALIEYPIATATDVSLVEYLHRRFHCYAIWPSVALQKPGWSILQNRPVDYLKLFDCKGKGR